MADEDERPASAALARLAPGSMFAGYRIESVIDRGGMGVVYKAIDPDLDRPVALKIIAPEHTQNDTAVARFKAECRLAASLEHPNIVPIHRGGEYQGVLYLAMRYVPGTNLREIIDRGPMDLPRVARIVDQVAAALDVAHDRGLVHRDVKPANILITGTGDREQAYLTDFGLTKRLGSIGALTRVGGWVGTPDYVAPEQIQGHHVDRRADVYSLGCVLFEMVTGHVAYERDSDMAKLWAHVSDPPPHPSTLRPELVPAFDEIVERATAKDPAARYPTAGAVSRAVRAAVAEQESRREGDATRPVAPAAGVSATRDEVFTTGSPQDTGGPAAVPASPAVAGPAAGAAAAAAAAATPPPAAAQPPPAAAAQQPPPAPPPPRGPGPAAATGRGPGRPGRAGRQAGSGGGDRRRRLVGLAALLLLLAGGVVAAVALLGGGDSTQKSATKTAPLPGQRISGSLGPVPTNRVTGKGDVVMRLDKGNLNVSLNTSGLLNAAHPLHIHAGAKGTCPTAAAAKDHNGHKTIATHDGGPFYGPPVATLTTRGDTSPDSIIAFGRYPSGGTIHYRRTIKVSPIVASYLRKNNAVVVVHGIDYNHNQIYDGVLERSDLNRSLTGESTAPALCGPVVAEKQKPAGTKTTAQARPRTHGEVFTASLRIAPPTPAVLLCHLGDAVDVALPLT